MSTSPTPWTSDLDFIEAELAWVAARAHRIALERRRDLAPEDRASRHGGFAVDHERIQPRELAERIEVSATTEHELRETIDARLSVHRESQERELGLDKLTRVHGLDQFDRVVLLLAAAPCVSRRFERLYGSLDSERMASLTPDVIFTFLDLASSERITRRGALGPRGRLVAFDLIEMNYGGRSPSPKDLLGIEVSVRPRTFSVLLGDCGLGDELADLARLETPKATFDQVVLPPNDRQRIQRVIDNHDRRLALWNSWGLANVIAYGRGVVLVFDGAPGTGKTMTAHAIAHRLRKKVLGVDLARFMEHEESGSLIAPLFREAERQGALLFFDEAECIFGSRRLGNALVHILLTELERFDGVAILATNLPELLDDAVWRRALVRVHFARPTDPATRAAIWRALIPPALPIASDVNIERLAEFDLAGGEIKNAVLTASAAAIYDTNPTTSPTITHAHFETAAKEQADARRTTRADHERVEREDAGSRAPRRRPAGFL